MKKATRWLDGWLGVKQLLDVKKIVIGDKRMIGQRFVPELRIEFHHLLSIKIQLKNLTKKKIKHP